MTTYSNFANKGFNISGKPSYTQELYGVSKTGNIYMKVINVPAAAAGVFYCGEPIHLEASNDVIKVSEIDNTTINGIVAPAQLSSADVVDKDNENIGYKTYNIAQGDLVPVLVPDNNDLIAKYKAGEKVIMGDKVTFSVDSNGIYQVVKANKAADIVYGVVTNKEAVASGELADVKLLNFNNLEVVS